MIYTEILLEHLPRGWKAKTDTFRSFRTDGWVTQFKIKSAPDVMGRVAYGTLYLNDADVLRWRHSVLVELCRMDSELVHELTLEE